MSASRKYAGQKVPEESVVVPILNAFALFALNRLELPMKFLSKTGMTRIVVAARCAWTTKCRLFSSAVKAKTRFRRRSIKSVLKR
jgi:hypothetical protein